MMKRNAWPGTLRVPGNGNFSESPANENVLRFFFFFLPSFLDWYRAFCRPYGTKGMRSEANVAPHPSVDHGHSYNHTDPCIPSPLCDITIYRTGDWHGRPPHPHPPCLPGDDFDECDEPGDTRWCEWMRDDDNSGRYGSRICARERRDGDLNLLAGVLNFPAGCVD